MTMTTTLFCQLVLLTTILPGGSGTAETADAEWRNFKRNYNRHFNFAEEGIRKQIFLEKLKNIELHNAVAGNSSLSYRLGVNRFADWKEAEIRRFLCLREAPWDPILRAAAPQTKDNVLDTTIPDNVDWRPKGWVTEVKNQGNCGSCYAFAAVGAIEGQYFRHTGKLFSFSEQQILDCSGPQGNEGCKGGHYRYAFRYIEQHGLVTSRAYPYTAEKGACRRNFQSPAKGTVRARISGYVNLPPGDEESLKVALARHGPVSVAVHASTNFMLYQKGIFHDDACEGVTKHQYHGALVVGYGSEGGDDFWIVKNSWGSDWGEGGYIRMRRGQWRCGITDFPAYPVLVSPDQYHTDHSTWTGYHYCALLVVILCVCVLGVFSGSRIRCVQKSGIYVRSRHKPE